MESHSLGSLFADLATVAGLILLAALFVAAEIAKWTPVIKAAGVYAD